jgi:hypothetical protein
MQLRTIQVKFLIILLRAGALSYQIFNFCKSNQSYFLEFFSNPEVMAFNSNGQGNKDTCD